ncbi:nucleoside deaminase [filamentous cyanobacterium LEGE 07170]|nr:nucleoside deaminase [filamentous cyanobacterium LEGE 07170]
MGFEPNLDLLRQAIALAKQARDRGNHPFGALLADADDNVILDAENTVVTTPDATGHAETNLVRLASQRFDRDFLATCTLYTSTEPCAMCAGAIYWSNIRRIVYGQPESALYKITSTNPENPTLALPCRDVFARGRHPVEVAGPFLEAEVTVVHADFWDAS